ncbi:MAG: hypothetical protein JNG88_13335, partial [Phycisphaerales bacterium]|nr:hypothetical protein [Phycisphaerales bacterium]
MVACVFAAALCFGCNEGHVRLTSLEKADLERRAFGLLERAAVGEIDVVRCNAIEALVDVRGARAVAVFRTALKSKAAMVRFAGLVALCFGCNEGHVRLTSLEKADLERRA